ncbi:hypothetical protein POM88_051838 [Heracleum sosnowskyi]|uniref:Uncharacterized protein n=1 Tax=Heracleum sosnowskyi TaxID=360622 RepID=A0AAD8GSX8_9APIA|nr:hypothetical protein POM88_051838 [Heracleum sosnowskyi]
MGSCMSSKPGSSSAILSSSSRTIRSSSNSLKYGNIVRVVHLNGWMEEFEDPVTVKQVTGNQPKHFVFPQAQLLSLDSKPMDSAAQLVLGNIYFLLPHSIFQDEMSPMDLVTIYKRLTSAAQKPVKPPNRTTADTNNNKVAAADTSTAAGQQQQQSKLKPNRYADRYAPPRMNTTPSDHMFYNYDQTSCGGLVTKQQQQQQQQVCDQSPRSWKPILESIIERSFTLRSTESDSSHQDTRR